MFLNAVQNVVNYQIKPALSKCTLLYILMTRTSFWEWNYTICIFEECHWKNFHSVLISISKLECLRRLHFSPIKINVCPLFFLNAISVLVYTEKFILFRRVHIVASTLLRNLIFQNSRIKKSTIYNLYISLQFLRDKNDVLLILSKKKK